MFKAKLKDERFGRAKNYDKALNTLGGGEQLELEVGLLEGVATPHVIFKGAINEVGDGKHIPERRWFRDTIDANAEKYLDVMADALRDAVVGENLDKVSGGGNDVRRELGERIAEDLREAITNFSTPANAKSTVQKKGFNNPLVETGDLAEAPDHRLVKRKGRKKR